MRMFNVITALRRALYLGAEPLHKTAVHFNKPEIRFFRQNTELKVNSG